MERCVIERSYAFGPFVLQPSRRHLLENGSRVSLGSRTLDLLVALVESRDRILSKTELMRRVWNDNTVEENNLSVNISVLRKALREQALNRTFIQTISGRGYRFVGLIDVHDTSPALRATAPAAEMPSIAVLPFANMSGVPEQDHFGDGIAEDIISELSRNRWLTVIARNSSFTFRGAAVDTREVARQFAVRYVLTGSVRRSGSRVRVTAQLIDATTSSHLTAVRYDRDLADFFAAQDEITTLVITAIRPVLYEAEQARSMRKPPDSLDAWAAYQRGVWHFSRFEQPESAEARTWFSRAIELDPRFAPGHYGLGLVYLHDGSAYVADVEPDWQHRGERLALQAVLLDERDSGSHNVLGLARMVRGDHAGSLDATHRALALNPNDATAHATHGATLVFSGRWREGLESLATSLRLSPRDSRLRIRQAHVTLGHYFGQDYEGAEASALGIIRRWPDYAVGPRLHAMILAETGRLAEAKCAIDRAIALLPAPFDDFSHARMPWYTPGDHRRVVESLRRAGWKGRAD